MYRVTWSERVIWSPGRSSPIRHQNALTEKAWEDTVQRMSGLLVNAFSPQHDLETKVMIIVISYLASEL